MYQKMITKQRERVYHLRPLTTKIVYSIESCALCVQRTCVIALEFALLVCCFLCSLAADTRERLYADELVSMCVDGVPHVMGSVPNTRECFMLTYAMTAGASCFGISMYSCVVNRGSNSCLMHAYDID
jgi:hypothetical protein